MTDETTADPAPDSETPTEIEVDEAPIEAAASAKPALAKRGGLAIGAAAVGVGSAAIVAALLYVRHRNKGA